MASTGPAFAVLYRWRLHAGMEDQFIDGWTRNSELFRSRWGSLGSRLHRGADGLWYSYAQWPSEAARAAAFAGGGLDAEASQQMREAIAEAFDEVVLEPVSDLLVLPPTAG